MVINSPQSYANPAPAEHIAKMNAVTSADLFDVQNISPYTEKKKRKTRTATASPSTMYMLMLSAEKNR